MSIYVNTSDIPTPFHVGQQNLLPVHVAVVGADIVNVHALVTLEGVTTEFDTNLLMPTDNFSYTTRLDPDTVDAACVLTLQAKLPPGYVDYDKSNNKVNITVDCEN